MKTKRPQLASTEEAARERVLINLGKMSKRDLFDLGVRAGIYTKSGKLTKPYRDDAEPSASRPTD